jgi:alanine dehydrogenase
MRGTVAFDDPPETVDAVSRQPNSSAAMRIGVPVEIKPDEMRVGLTPSGTRELTTRGHEVFLQNGAGEGSGFADADYRIEGATLVDGAAELFAAAELIVKVKEPQPGETAMLAPRHTLFTYLHLAPSPSLTDELLASGATCIAYEIVEDERGRLPLLAPMSEVAGRLAPQAGALALERAHGGRGVLLGGVTGVLPASVLVIGAGIVGRNAAQVALGLGARTYLLDRSPAQLRDAVTMLGGSAATCVSAPWELERLLPQADLVIGAVLIPGARAPRIITQDHLSLMKPGAVLVDVSIDQGGCFETSRPTTHHDPTYTVAGVNHYCVTNMPGTVPATSTRALTNATLPYVMRLADLGVSRALCTDPGFAKGLSAVGGVLTSEPVATAQGRAAQPVSTALKHF